jgi:hypothetical protein
MLSRRCLPSDSRLKIAWCQPLMPTGVYVWRPICSRPPEANFRKTCS